MSDDDHENRPSLQDISEYLSNSTDGQGIVEDEIGMIVSHVLGHGMDVSSMIISTNVQIFNSGYSLGFI